MKLRIKRPERPAIIFPCKQPAIRIDGIYLSTNRGQTYNTGDGNGEAV